MDALFSFFNTNEFLPHGTCLLWWPELLALHVGADFLTGAAYFTIPLALIYFIRHRPDLRFQWVFWMFVAFITACGATHLFSIYTLWIPSYGAEGLLKLATAAVSTATAAMLWWKMPAALAVPSRAQLEDLNEKLLAEGAEREEAQRALKRLNGQLELRIKERTRELEAANTKLRQEIADRARADEEQQRLLSEFEHRLKNTMSTVIAIANQTLGADRPIAEARDALEKRLHVLGNTHALLSRSSWRAVKLGEIINSCLAPYRDGAEGNASVEGPEVELDPSAVLYMGLVFHELATNAAKYGAFSAKGGRVSVAWHLQDGAMHLQWREEGGPEVGPLGSGFGTNFIERVVRMRFGGTTHRNATENGIAWTFVMSLDSLEHEEKESA